MDEGRRKAEVGDQRSGSKDKGERQWNWEGGMRNLELTKDEERINERRGTRDERRGANNERKRMWCQTLNFE